MKTRVSQPTAAGKLTNRVKLPACCVAIISTALLSLFAATPALAGNGYEKVTSTFGSAGTGPGQFNEPTAIAVNDETEEVYVLDSGNDRIEYFTSTGTYLGQFNGSGEYEVGVKKEKGTAAGFGGQPGEIETGKFLEPSNIAVDNDPSSESYGDVYVADSGDDVVDKFSATGEYKGQLTGFEPALLNVAVDTSGNVWVGDAQRHEIGGGESRTYVYEFSDIGSLENKVEVVEPAEVPGAFAVDSSGDVYASRGNRVNEYDKANGYERIIITQSASGLATLAIISSTNGLLVDEGSSIELFKSPFSQGQAPILTFPATGLSESEGIAVNGAKGDGTVYATQRGEDNVDVFASAPAKAPEIVSESASTVGSAEEPVEQFAAVIEPGNRTTKYSFEYSKEAGTNGTGELELKGTISTVAGEKELLAEFGDQMATSQAVELKPYYETYYYRVVAENEESKGKPAYGKVEAYTKLPLVENEKVSGLTSTSAKLEGTVNPVFVTAESAYTIEYAASEAQLGTSEATVFGPYGTGEVDEPEPVSVEISGLQPGHTYYYRVVAQSFVTKNKANANKGEPVHGKTEEVTPYGAPGIVTGEAQNITGTAATLSGSVNPKGTEATYYFAYIGKAGYEKAVNGDAQEQANPYAEGETTATFSLAASASPQAVGPIPADDLLPGETYHYALVAKNKFAIQAIGPDHMFTTGSATPPAVSTGAASNVSQNSATLSGTVTTNGLQTNYGFEIGTGAGGGQISYGPATGLGAIGGALTEEVHVTLGELAPGTTYYYRVTATNKDGTEKGQPQSFTTPGFPTLIAPPASPLVIPYTSPGFPAEEKPSGTSTKALTSKQKLAKALEACKRDHSKARRTACEKAAHKRYAPVKKRGRK